MARRGLRLQRHWAAPDVLSCCSAATRRRWSSSNGGAEGHPPGAATRDRDRRVRAGDRSDAARAAEPIGTVQLASIGADGSVRTVRPRRDLRGLTAPARQVRRRQASPGLAANGLAGGRGRARPPGRGPSRDDGRDRAGPSTAARPRDRRSSSRAGVTRRSGSAGTRSRLGLVMGPDGPRTIGVRLLNVATGDARTLDAFSIEAARAGSDASHLRQRRARGYRPRRHAAVHRPSTHGHGLRADGRGLCLRRQRQQHRSPSSTSRRADRRAGPHREADLHPRALDSPDGDRAAGRRGRRRRDRPDSGRVLASRLHGADAGRGGRGVRRRGEATALAGMARRDARSGKRDVRRRRRRRSGRLRERRRIMGR